MATAQLLARASTGAQGDLELVEADFGMSSQALSSMEKTAPGKPVILGTEVLLRLAVALRDRGYSASHLELTDSRFRTDPDGSDDIREVALDLLRYEPIEAVLEYFMGKARGFYVVNLELRSKQGSGRFNVRRSGWITIQNASTTQSVKLAIRSLSRQVGIV